MTDILKRLADLKQQESNLKKEAKKITKEFESYISDKTIPLGKRWFLFVEAPDTLSNHERYFIKAQSKGLQHIKDNWFDAPEVYGRGKRINTKELFEDIFEDESLAYDSESYDPSEIELYKDAMEDILNQNCASFCFDW